MTGETTTAVVSKLEFLNLVIKTDDTRKVLFGREGQLRRNLLTEEIELGGVRIGVEAADLVPIRVRIAETTRQQFSKALEFTAEAVRDVVEHHADQNAYHPVEDWLTGLRWDGRDRLTGELPAAFGHVAGTIEATFLRKTMRAAVARATRPGCKVDTVLVLVGDQGILKSTAIGALGRPWFTDQAIEIGDKDGLEVCHRFWLVELGELSALRKADLEAVKAFISKCDDTYRSPYGRKAKVHPRRFIFIGTTNEPAFLRDATGNRRFWPLPVQQERINIEYLTKNREQLFAQAAHEVLGGAAWWLEGEEDGLHRAVAEEHTEIDPWDQPVADYMARTPADGMTGVGSEYILKQVTGKDMATWGAGDTRRVCAILTRQGAQRGPGRSRYRWFWGRHVAQPGGER